MLPPAVDEFFAATGPLMPAYHYKGFAYLALRRSEHWVVLKGALFLNSAVPPRMPLTRFNSESIRAGHYFLSELGADPRALVGQVFAGRIETPDDALVFPRIGDNTLVATHDPFHSFGPNKQERCDVLRLWGADISPLNQQALDWELRAAPTPYFNLQELMAVYDMGGLDQRSSFEIIALRLLSIDGGSSRVDDTNAAIQVRVCDGLDANWIGLGCRVIVGDRCVERLYLRGAQLQWSDAEGARLGLAEFAVPSGALVHCNLSYNGAARQHWWVADPGRSQNPRRAAYETIDPNLEVLREYIAGRGRREQDDFETGVAWLLWMLGFSPAHVGINRRWETADIIVATPMQHLAVVECTTGLLKAENKMARLVARAERVRKMVLAPIKVIPVMITALTRNEVRADLEAAEKLGVLVITKEELEEALSLRTLLVPNADALYEEAERAIERALALKNAEPELDLRQTS